MDLTISPAAILTRAIELLSSPHHVWEKIKSDTHPWQQALLTYFVPLTILAHAIWFIEMAIVGVPTVVGRITTPFSYALFYCGFSAAATPLFAMLLAKCATVITEKLKYPSSFDSTVKLIAYAATPLFVVPILGYLPFAETLTSFVILYSVYLAAYGSGPLLGLNRENQILFGIGILGVSILLTMVFGFLLSPLMPQPVL